MHTANLYAYCQINKTNLYEPNNIRRKAKVWGLQKEECSSDAGKEGYD